MAMDPYASGVLQEEFHDRLVADLDNYARDAGIQPHWIYDPLPETVTKAEREYLRQFKRHCADGSLAGLCFTAKAKMGLTVEQYMSALAGCLVRNFVRARVMTLGAVLDAQSSGTMPDLSCLLIPNFFRPAAEGGTIATWQVSAIYDLLVARHTAGLQTILFASDLNLLAKEYGVAVYETVADNYRLIGA